ncbi:hypothetical protein GCM10010922_19560 [Microbacterium sorbitolivorans]|uniref:Histidinol dehydrogenase n=1 Tax=Microbacterium sorbitolivorans TaxID=1867410 RepID=A0A367Y843_9MICO|nr:histidinol dehydrogenase [Microbacterium sorbitolivorans]RCK61987.1 histidinol dehydrogenase [Microbacterium sorbitolivorans]GGF44060.1 hypothetical protein GCM10010922_19560 [Microbacterium sorbitolivorans]
MTWPARIVTWILALVAGAVFGVAGTITHAYTAGPIPVGLVVACVACAAILVAVRLLIEERGVVWWAGFGMLGAMALFSGRGPGGSVVVPQAAEGEFPYGIVWMAALTLIVVGVAAWPRIRPARQVAE